ncbi:MAG: ABC transporter ATP-binding protein [Bacteroidota bacterium]
MITVNDLWYTYPKNKNLTLKGISFAIEAGEIFGFLGPSGSGKSTTQKILYKLLDGYTGQVQIQGKDLLGWGKDFYQRIGVSFELPNHYLKLTALENLQFFANFYERKPTDFYELLDKVGLKEDADKPVADFSKGMKMRLNFIRSFLHDPDILFLDEPTSGLDPVNGKIIKDIILDLKAQGKTIFITTHSMYDADALCDRIALIIDGEIKALDRPAALKLQHGKRKVRVEAQNNGVAYEYALDTLGQNEEFLSILQENNIRTIHSEEATLEDVFIKLTGQSLV